LKQFLKIILQEIMKKNNIWNIRHLVNESIVPNNLATYRIILKIVGFQKGERQQQSHYEIGAAW
jgi:hypothetical protein